MRQKDNYVTVKRATPKHVNLSNGISFVARYERVPRDRLPPNVTMRRRYQQKLASKNKCRRQDGRGLLSFIKEVAKKPAVKALGRAALKSFARYRVKKNKK